MDAVNQSNSHKLDKTLLMLVVALVWLGVYLVYDASYAKWDGNTTKSGLSFLFRQIVYVGIGSVLMIWSMNFDYHRWKKHSSRLMAAAVILLIVVLVPHIGKDIAGGRRWVGVGSITFQPSELCKFAMILYLASLLTFTREKLKGTAELDFEHLIGPLFVTGFAAALIVVEPDLGTAVILVSTVLTVLHLAGAKTRNILAVMGICMMLFVLATAISSFRRERFKAWLDPYAYKKTIGYQQIHSLYGVVGGRLVGVGPSQGRLKFYLPEANTDYIFVTAAEEGGLLGSVLIVGLFLLVSWRAFDIAKTATDTFGQLVAGGISAMLTWQAIINLAVVTNSIPSTGVPLPFLSYGGTSLIIFMLCIGILLNISRTCTGKNDALVGRKITTV